MKIATWNVNGIRARQAQVQEWIARERPDVVCLQEIKATPDQVPDRPLRDARATGATGTAARAIRRRPARQQDARRRAPGVLASRRSTSRTASSPSSVGDADRRVDLRARTAARTSPPRCGFSRRWTPTPRRSSATGRHAGRCCGDLNVARTDRDVHPKERKPRAIGQLPEERALIERILEPRPGRRRPRARSGQRRPVHLVGAVAQHARSATSAGASTTCSRAQPLAARAVSCPVQAEVGTSDHAPVMATFA